MQINSLNEKKRALHLAAKRKFQQLATHNKIYHRLSYYNLLIPLSEGKGLLFNSISRALCLLTTSEVELYQQLEKNQLNINQHKLFLKQLSVEGFLVNENINEKDMFKERYFAQRHDETRLGLTIAPTMNCNLACTYCFQGQNKQKFSLSTKLSDSILALVEKKIRKINNLSITWYGGEPLMKSNKLIALSEHLIRLCQDNNVAYHAIIVTNGVFLNKKIAISLLEQGCSMAQVTIDGPQAIHDSQRPTVRGKGSFLRIMNNLAEVLSHTELAISLRVNVGKDNIHTCSQLLDEIELRGLHKFPHFSLYFAPIDASTEVSGAAFEQSLGQQQFFTKLAPFRQRAKQMGLMPITQAPFGYVGQCVATLNGDMVIAPNGEIHKCWETMHEPKMRVGSLAPSNKVDSKRLEQHNLSLWNNFSPFDNPVCWACKVLPLCAGKCAQRFVYFGEGAEHALPCHEWKWSTAELIFERALEQGFVSQNDWLDDFSTLDSEISGKRHDSNSMQHAKNQLYNKVKNESLISQ